MQFQVHSIFIAKRVCGVSVGGARFNRMHSKNDRTLQAAAQINICGFAGKCGKASAECLGRRYHSASWREIWSQEKKICIHIYM